MSQQAEKKVIPPAPVSVTTGNLLSSVAPPSMLPNFVTAPVQTETPNISGQLPSSGDEATASSTFPQPMNVTLPSPQTPDKFSPAIPPSKGEPTLAIRSPDGSQATTQSPMSLPSSTPDLDTIGDPMPGSGLFTWVKGAVSSGGLLHRVAEKAKSSVDSLVTTLDPQMKEYIYSGGDIYLVVTSADEAELTPVREAFQAVFGRATVVGFGAPSGVTAEQPVGYAAAYAAAKQRIAYLRSTKEDIHNNVPVVAVENFLVEWITDRWCDMNLLVLSLPSLGVELHATSQGTAVPSAAVAALRAATPEDCPRAQSGFRATLAPVMGANLKVHSSQWHEACTGVSRREVLHLAAKSLAGSYKQILLVSSTATV